MTDNFTAIRNLVQSEIDKNHALIKKIEKNENNQYGNDIEGNKELINVIKIVNSNYLKELNQLEAI